MLRTASALKRIGVRRAPQNAEYRRNVNHGRIFRMFFTLEEKKICFLYGFIKKTQSTPQKELEKGRNLLQMRKKQ